MTKNRIGALRREAGLNQRELGMKLGVGQTTVSAWETGKNEPDNESMHKMAQMFHVSIGYLAGYEHDEVRRGLTEAEINAYWEKQQAEKELAEYRREAARDESELSEEEKQELMHDQILEAWEQTDRSTYLEVFQLQKMCDYLTEDQRKRLVVVAEQMFPNAARGQYTEEIAHK